MKYLSFVFLCCVPFFACKHSAAPETHPFRVMSYNIRFDTYRDTGNHDWINRKQQVAEVMQQAEIIGIQEPTSGQVADLREYLSDYETFSQDTFDINAIFFLSERFRLVRADTIRLPRLDGSAADGLRFLCVNNSQVR